MEQKAILDKLSNRRNGVSLVTWFILCGLLIVLRLPPNLQTASTWITNRNKEIEGGQILVNGASIRGINDLEFGPDGLLFAASTLGNEIVILHPQSGAIIERIDEAQGVKAPSALVFGPDGTLYWASLFRGEVGRRGIDGEIRTQYVAEGIHKLSFTDGGEFFAGCGMLGEKVYKLDPELIEPPHPINSMSGIDIVTGESETGAASALIPIMSDSQGRLYTARARGQIDRLDPRTQTKDIVAQLPAGIGSLALNTDDILFVANVQDGAIYQIFPNGEWLTMIEGGIVAPGGIAVVTHPNGDESVYVADFWTLREYDGKTGTPGHVEHHLRGPAHIIPPLTVAADGENLIISSWASGVGVQIWNPRTKEVVERYTEFSMPINAIRFQDKLIVVELSSDYETSRIIQVTPEGSVTLADSQNGFQIPAGLAVSKHDLWVSDWATGTVWQIVADDAYLSPPDLVFSGLDHPEGLAVNPDGNLLVVESGLGQLSRIDLKTKQKTVVADNLAFGTKVISEVLPPTWIFNGVAVGKSGTIYITGDVGNVVYRFDF